MNYEQKLKLKEMINTNNTIDNTEKIRELKHSKKIRDDINKLSDIMKSNDDKTEIDRKAQKECFFLFLNYTIIYNKLIKNELDLKIMYEFLDILESIENCKDDQHEASYKVGMLLKSIFIDNKIDTETYENKNKKPSHNISWFEYSRDYRDGNT